MEALIVSLQSVWNDSGFEGLTSGNVIMLLVGLILLYMAIGKGFEPLLLSNIAFGCLLGNIPKTGFFDEPGVMQVILYGINHEVFPPLIFMGVGAMTDFGPLLANPKTLLLGAAAPYLEIEFDELEKAIKAIFGRKGDAVVETNIKAIRAGRDAK